MSTRIGALTRTIAIDALTHVLTRHVHSDVALERLFNHHQKELRSLDRAFIYEMVMGSLRWMSKIDWIMGHVLTQRPLQSLDPRVANSLRIGAYQLFYMDRVPARAAVSETVEAVKHVGVPNASSLVNAVLRRLSKKAEYFQKPDKEKNLLDYYSMQYAHPRWMVERWMHEIPSDRLEHVLIGNNKIPSYTLRILKRNTPLMEEDLDHYLLRTQGIKTQHRPLAGALHIESLPNFKECEGFQKGLYIVQDEASQLVTSILNAGPEDICLDTCAAPGGKAIDLWDNGVKPENLTVCDISNKRLVTLLENFERVNLLGARIIHGDWEKKEFKDHLKHTILNDLGTFTKILLDAPCSATGVIRRHPEIKWLRTPADITTCAEKQSLLLKTASQSLLPGGELLYTVCSIEREETNSVIDKFLMEEKEFAVVDPTERIHPHYRKYIAKNKSVLILPGNHDNIDGFYACLLKRK